MSEDMVEVPVEEMEQIMVEVARLEKSTKVLGLVMEDQRRDEFLWEKAESLRESSLQRCLKRIHCLMDETKVIE